jgi:Fic family protein
MRSWLRQTKPYERIPLQEAKLSSEIENIVTTQDALFQAALDESRVTDPAVKEVLRYRTALRRGFEAVQAEPFRLSLLEELCGVLCNEKIQFRGDKRVYIGNPATKTIIHPALLQESGLEPLEFVR